MGEPDVIADLVGSFSLRDIVRVDASLEGAWAEQVRTIWTPDSGLDMNGNDLSHEAFTPSIELMFDGFWLGLPCFVREGERKVFDRDRAGRIVAAIESAV